MFDLGDGWNCSSEAKCLKDEEWAASVVARRRRNSTDCSYDLHMTTFGRCWRPQRGRGWRTTTSPENSRHESKAVTGAAFRAVVAREQEVNTAVVVWYIFPALRKTSDIAGYTGAHSGVNYSWPNVAEVVAAAHAMRETRSAVFDYSLSRRCCCTRKKFAER